MMSTIKVFVCLLTMLLFSASTLLAQSVKKLPTKMDSVMSAHDEVMDQMPELAKLISKLEVKAKEMKPNNQQAYLSASDDLKAANTAMMNWMIRFGERFKADEMYKGKPLTAQKEIWLLEEEQKIAQLRHQVEQRIKQAQKLL